MNWVNFCKILLLAALSVLPLRKSPGQVTQNQRRTVAAANPKPAAPHKPANLPERWIEISIPSESGDSTFWTDREERDRSLDFALVSTVLRVRPGAATAKRLAARVPVLRSEELESATPFTSGDTRFFSLDSASLVALVPQSDARRDLRIGQMLDQHVMVYGVRPTAISVFEYRTEDPEAKDGDDQSPDDLDDSESLWIRNATARPVSWYFSTEAGFVTARVAGVADLTRFLESIDDIVSVRKEAGALVFGGRRLGHEGKGWFKTEDVAALYQADLNLTDIVRQNVRGGELRSDYEESIDRLVRQRLARSLTDDLTPEKTEEMLNLFRREISTQYPFSDYESEKIQSAFDEHPPQIGFSLDPRANYAHMAEAIEGLSSTGGAAYLRQHGWSEASSTRLLEAAKIRDASLKQIASAVRQQNLGPLYDFRAAFESALPEVPQSNSPRCVVLELQRMLEAAASGSTGMDGLFGRRTQDAIRGFQKKSELNETGQLDENTWKKLLDSSKEIVAQLELISRALLELRRGDQYQCARYDGRLQGTPVGMTLFYTDLVMKLWSMDYHESTPPVPGFVPTTDYNLSTLHWDRERHFSATRNWLAPRPDAYEIEANGAAMRLAPVATRLLAASYNPLQPGKEVVPTYSAERLHRWWNRNYEAVADYEPQFHRLNQIQKWALILDWLKRSKSPVLAGLSALNVEHPWTFDRWMAANQQLRYREPLPFLNPATTGASTECLAILVSDSTPAFGYGTEWTISGGVTAGDHEQLGRKLAASQRRAEWPVEARQQGIEYTKSAVKPEGVELEFADGRKVAISNTRGEVSFHPAAAHPLTGNETSLRTQDLAVRTVSNPGGVTYEMQAGGKLWKTVSMRSTQRKIEFAVKQGPLGELEEALRDMAPRRYARPKPVGIPVADGTSILWLPDSQAWAQVKLASLRPLDWKGTLQFGYTGQTADAGVFDARLIASSEAEKTLQSPWNRITWSGDSHPAGGLYAGQPPEGAVVLEVSGPWGKRTGVATKNAAFVPNRPPAVPDANLRMDPAAQALRSMDSAVLNRLFADLKSSAVGIMPGGDPIVIAAGAPLGPSEFQRATALGESMPLDVRALIFKNTPDERIRVSGAVIEMPVRWLRDDAPELARYVRTAGRSDEVLDVLEHFGPVSKEDLLKTAALNDTQLRSYFEFKGVPNLGPEYALADLRLNNDGTTELVVRNENETLTLPVPEKRRQDILRATARLNRVYIMNEGIDTSALTSETVPYFEQLQAVAKAAGARTIVVRSEGRLDPAAVWALHGGDPATRFVWDQEDINASVKNAMQKVFPTAAQILVGVSTPAPWSTPAPQGRAAERLARLEASALASARPLTPEGVLKLVKDGSPHFIVWIASALQVQRLLSSMELDRVKPEQAPRRDVLLLVCACTSYQIERLANTGMFLRVAWAPFASLDPDGVAEGMETAVRIIDGFSTHVAVVRPEELSRQLGGDAGLMNAVRAASETAPGNWRIDLLKISASLRDRLQSARQWLVEKVGPRTEPLDPQHPNRDFDSLVEAVGRDRIRQARTAPSGVEAGRVLRSIPRYKVENRLPPRVGLPGQDHPLERQGAE